MKLAPVKFLKKTLLPAFCLCLIALSSFTLIVNTWKVKGDQFEVRFEGGKIHGIFKQLITDIKFDKDDPAASKINASINVNSISTGFFIKNDHARAALESDRYPTISFVSTSVVETLDSYEAIGKLTIKGITKPVTIYFNFEDKGSEAMFRGSFKIFPKEFKISADGTPDQLTIYLTVPVVK